MNSDEAPCVYTLPHQLVAGYSLLIFFFTHVVVWNTNNLELADDVKADLYPI